MARSDIAGIARKPDHCLNSCPLAYRGSGFVADHVGAKPLIGLLQATPTKKDALERNPMASYGGFLYLSVFKPLGLSKDNLVVSHVLRCDNYVYPTAGTRRRAENACRAYDTVSRDASGAPRGATGLKQWDPNLFILTFNLSDAMGLAAYQALFRADVAKALRFAKSGYRPLLVMGREAMEVFAPIETVGGLKKHRGDWWEGQLPYEVAVPQVRYQKELVPVEDLLKKPKAGPVAQQLSLFEG